MGRRIIDLLVEPGTDSPEQDSEHDTSDAAAICESFEDPSSGRCSLASDDGSITNHPESRRRKFSRSDDLVTQRPEIRREREQWPQHERDQQSKYCRQPLRRDAGVGQYPFAQRNSISFEGDNQQSAHARADDEGHHDLASNSGVSSADLHDLSLDRFFDLADEFDADALEMAPCCFDARYTRRSGHVTTRAAAGQCFDDSHANTAPPDHLERRHS